MEKIWLATQVSYQPVSGIKAVSLGVYSNEGDARAACLKAMKAWRETWKKEGVELDVDKLVGWFDYDPLDRCKWIITPTEI